MFMQGGVVDYFNMEAQIEAKMAQVQALKLENTHLEQEIKKIKTDASYQKQLARESLGVIAKDEYLIVFPREKVSQSI